MRKSLEIGIFLVAVFILIGVMGLTAEAADVSVDPVNRMLWIEDDADYDLDDVYGDADVDDTMLWEESADVWIANYSININASSTLRLNSTAYGGVTWLKLNTSNATGLGDAHINVSGRLFVNDTMITGWNWTGDCNQTWWGATCTFRPYIYILPISDADDTHAVFLNSTIGYLGYNLDNRYGIVYEDIADLDPTGYMHNCTVMENFQGINFQGCEDMNVTDTWINNSKESGITYTTGGATGEGSNRGYIGDNQDTGLWPSSRYDGVTVIDTYGDATANGIRLLSSENMTFEDVDIINATKSGLYITSCDNITANNTLSYLNTNAVSDWNILITNSGNCTFDNCSAFSPDGAADGGNWKLTGANTNTNTFTNCRGNGSVDCEDFYLNTGVYSNTFTECTANNSESGFFCYGDNNNTFTDCISHNHTLYDYKFYGSQHNTITNGYANDSYIGVYILDIGDATIAHNNNVNGIEVNTQSSYGIKIGVVDNICHNNTIEAVTVVGTTSGDGIYIFGNCTYNWVGNSSVTYCTHGNADGMGLANWSNYNTFYNCNSSFNGNDGFQLKEYAHHNTISYCYAYDNSYDGLDLENNVNYNTISDCTFTTNDDDGIDIAGDVHHNTISNCVSTTNVDDGIEIDGDVHNNTITYATVDHNAWGVFMWPDEASNCRDNNFSWCEIHNNTQAGVDYGRAPINYFHYCNIKDNTLQGVEVSTDGVAQFFKCVVWDSGSYDWDFDNSATVDVYGDYILGTNHTVNNQTGVSPIVFKGWVDHNPGDGPRLLDTYEMGAWATAAGDYILVNLTHWRTDYRQWYGNATNPASSLFRAYCGGLRAGIVYDLLVGNVVYGSYTAISGTVIGSAAGIVWFNYTGTWSNKLFEIKLHVAEEPPGPGGNGVSDKNDIDVYVLTDDDVPIEGALVYIYEGSVLVKNGVTDSDGLYDTTLDDGTYKFVVSADDYREEFKTETITSDTTVVFHLETLGICPAILAGPYLGISALGWIIVVILAALGFLIAYLIDSKQVKKDYLGFILVPNAVLFVFGLFCHPLLIVIGVACGVIQFLWAKEERL